MRLSPADQLRRAVARALSRCRQLGAETGNLLRRAAAVTGPRRGSARLAALNPSPNNQASSAKGSWFRGTALEESLKKRGRERERELERGRDREGGRDM